MCSEMLVTVLALLVTSVGAESGHWDERIIGGTVAADGAYPFAASLINSTGHHCTAAIITKRCLISNAACAITAKNGNGFRVLVGKNSLSAAGGAYYDIASIARPETYNDTNFFHNIAILKVSKDIEFTNKVKPIRLTNIDTPASTWVTFVGWGKTSYPGEMSDKLRSIPLQTKSARECANNPYPTFPTSNKLCTSNSRNLGLCTGDHGGPLFRAKSLIGVASTLVECATGTTPDMFENIFYWIDWIKSQCDIPLCV